MSTVTKQYLGYIAPEYSSIDDERFNALKEIAEEFVDETLFKTRTNYAVALYIAHILKIGEGQGTTGEVVSRTVGDVNERYQTMIQSPTGNTGLSQTSYGRQYLEVRKTIVKTPIING